MKNTDIKININEIGEPRTKSLPCIEMEHNGKTFTTEVTKQYKVDKSISVNADSCWTTKSNPLSIDAKVRFTTFLLKELDDTVKINNGDLFLAWIDNDHYTIGRYSNETLYSVFYTDQPLSAQKLKAKIVAFFCDLSY